MGISVHILSSSDMKGEYSFQVRGKRTRFSFRIRRNITVLKGDSANGKTTLLMMMYEYLRTGRESGYSVTTDARYYVYLRDEVGRDWTDVLYPLKDTVIFIEENNDFIFGKQFAEFVKSSGNYFVLVNRAPLKMLPYSIHEIYEIVMEGQRGSLKETWHTFRELYSNFPVPENNHLQMAPHLAP
ncbi:MAG: Fis family transcriptional regulator [Lachnospiraceae bacterium]|nr:Fis family transcriptional regulator [Lachnospiraceae bacterium]